MNEKREFPSGMQRAAQRAEDDLPGFRLRVVKGSAAPQLLSSAGERVLIGRGDRADLRIDEESLAPAHCEIVPDGNSFVLRDLGSPAGTRLGAVRIREAFLPARARIFAGAVELAFETGPSPSVDEPRFGGLLGESDTMRVVFDRLERVAARDTTLLLEGESGTGKHLAAEAVHRASRRREGPFVVVDCRSMLSSLLDAELVGRDHEATTGSTAGDGGVFGRANGGTVFFDEIGDLGLDLQRWLLGVIERKELAGAARSGPVDVRIIAATGRDLLREVSRGIFREDLYYSLAVTSIRLPPLRERPSDVPILVRHFLRERAQQEGGAPSELGETTLARLMQRPWPGNVRELRNAVEQILAFGADDDRAPDSRSQPVSIDVPFKTAKAQLIERFEHEYLVSVLERHRGNFTAAASASGLDRVHFLRLLDRHGLRKSSARPPSS